MNLPFSVLNSKKNKPVRIHDLQKDNLESKSIVLDVDSQIDLFLKSGIIINNMEDIVFIKHNIAHFYKNNIAVLLLTLIFRRDQSFLYNPNYDEFVKYISRGVIPIEKYEEFKRKLNFEIQCYNEKIDNIIKSQML